MKVIQGGFGKQTEEEVEDVGLKEGLLHLLEATGMEDFMGTYTLILNNDGHCHMMSSEEDLMAVIAVLEVTKTSVVQSMIDG